MVSKIFKKLPYLIIILILLGAFGYIFKYTYIFGPATPRGAEKYGWQALFLINNQVYFGKLKETKDKYVLSNIYYLQVDQPIQFGQQEVQGDFRQDQALVPSLQPDIRLIKLGSEIHGPKDKMYIERSNVLFWENLKEDSRIVGAIKRFQK